MTVVTPGFSFAVAPGGSGGRRRPMIGVTSLGFGCWYAAAAWSLMPYPF